MHLSDLYQNPAVEAPYYVQIKVIEIQIEGYLYAVLHPCLSAEYPRKKFRDGFGIADDNFEQAEGQWAAIRLVPAEYGGTKFSNAQFVAQTPISRKSSEAFARAEAKGEMPPWDDEPDLVARGLIGGITCRRSPQSCR